MNTHLEYTLNYFNLPNKQIDLSKVINVYLYGSHVYDTNTPTSDIDYIIVYDQDIDFSDTLKTKIGDMEMNATLISPTYFKKMVDDHKIDALECIFIREDWKHETMNFNFKLNLENLRKSISSVSSNSWVKCMKKLADGEDYIGKKSLFHSFRILDYGIQVAIHGSIISYTQPQSGALEYDTFKDLLNEIMSMKSWDEIKNKYQKTHNKLKSEFKIVAPK